MTLIKSVDLEIVAVGSVILNVLLENTVNQFFSRHFKTTHFIQSLLNTYLNLKNKSLLFSLPWLIVIHNSL